jgi:ATP synthase mitochondrial F1 complex assembly factor 1
VYNKQRQLKDVMKTDLLDGRSAKEIAEIWTSYHKGKEGHISGVVPAAMYDSIVERANQFPIFLYPLPRAGGYEFFVAEFQARECYFTQLISYQTRQADSPPCLSVIHFEDCKKDGIVLMRGEFDHKILNPAEVQCLLNQMQLYYGTEDKEKKRLLESFNKHPDTFKHMDLISEVEHSFAALKS